MIHLSFHPCRSSLLSFPYILNPRKCPISGWHTFVPPGNKVPLRESAWKSPAYFPCKPWLWTLCFPWPPPLLLKLQEDYNYSIYSHRAFTVLFLLLESEWFMTCNIKTLFFGYQVTERNINDVKKTIYMNLDKPLQQSWISTLNTIYYKEVSG